LTFVVAETIEHDKVARVANLLVQALGQISPAGALTYTQFQSLYVSVSNMPLSKATCSMTLTQTT